MRWIDRWRWLAVCLALPVAACDIPPEVQAEMTCTTLCTCFGGFLPDTPQLEGCVQQCVSEGEFGNLPQDCFECIEAHKNACSTLEDDCEPICDRDDQPPPPDQPPDGGL